MTAVYYPSEAPDPGSLVEDLFTSQGDSFDPATVAWVLNREDIEPLERAILGCSEVVIDLETTGLNEHETGERAGWPVPARVALAAITLPDSEDPYHPKPSTFVVPLSHPDSPLRGVWRDVLRRIAAAIRRSGRPITNANMKFDARWIFAHTGVDLSGQIAWDTQISSHLLDENSSTRLKERAPDTFGVERWDDFDLSTPAAAERVPLFDLGLYGARDTYWTWRLALNHRHRMRVGAERELSEEPDDPDEIEDARLGSLAVWCAMPTVSTLTAIEQRGMALDVEWVDSKYTNLEKQRKAAYAALSDRYGPPDHSHPSEVPCSRDCQRSRYIDAEPSFAPTSLWFMQWADLAVSAGDLRVDSLTPTGRPQWSKSVLVRQAREGSEVAETLLSFREASKQQEFLRSWLDLVTPEGRVHTTYHAGRVVTGRLSSSDPNIQQVTRALKPAFVPSPGYLIAELDYSQIELRVAAFVSRSEPMIQAYLDGLDLHRILAGRAVGVDPWEVNSEQRQQGKAGNFGFLYGMAAEGFREYAETSYGVTLTSEEANEIREAFFSQWEGISAWHAKAVARARQTGQVVSPIGRVRRLPGIWSPNERLASMAERQAINSPVQGFASDLMQLAASSIEGNLPGFDPVPGVRLIGTVHDSIVAEVPEGDWKRATGRCMQRMLNLHPVLERMGCHLDVPLGVEAAVGSRWGLADVGVIK